MVQLMNLPNEILLQIIRNLFVDKAHWTEPKNEVHMTSLRLVNRALSELVDKVWTKGFRLCGYNNHKFPRKFPVFASHVARNPTRRKSITSIQLDLDFIVDEFMLIRHDNYVLLNDLKNVAPRYWDAELSKKWQLGQAFHVYPHVIALLSILPNVKNVYIRVHLKETQPGDCSNLNSTQMVDFKTSLSSLRDVAFEVLCDGLAGPKNGVQIPLRPLLALSKLPVLRLLFVHGIDLTSYFEEDETLLSYLKEGGHPMKYFERLSLPIKAVAIEKCIVKNSHMQYFIRACRSLMHFSFSEWSGKEQVIAMEPVDVEGWHDALLLHQNSLEDLKLRCMGEWRVKRYETGCEPLPVWPSFAAFNRLRTLSVEYRRIKYGHLPRTLQQLFLIDCREIKDTHEIAGWKRLKSDYCPNINFLSIEVTHKGYSIHRQVKYSGFRNKHDVNKTRLYNRGGFDIEVFFLGPESPYKPRRSWNFPEGSDSSSADSYGDKVDFSDDEDWEPEENGWEQEKICKEEYENAECDEEEVKLEDWDEDGEIQLYLQHQENEREGAAVDTSEGCYTDAVTDEDEGYEAESSDAEEESVEDDDEEEN
ncbi:hypothetical protein DM02DRAFT_668314 [Periconia macrospinosa]|uniref:Uncharacterized protein n=1 Tax=Periconia macrospinosa TaxID=97972 RepID=A0A2V1E810_9PLEO|nr:hypothetical protein DM02DRAFT_668314 [Periconia macrospinosa]